LPDHRGPAGDQDRRRRARAAEPRHRGTLRIVFADLTPADLGAARQSLQLPQMLAKLDRYDLLILDDISYVRKDRAEISVLFELTAERYERRSLPLAANQPFSSWDNVFLPDPAMTVAAIDGLVCHATIFEISAIETYRGKQAALEQQALRDSDNQNRRPRQTAVISPGSCVRYLCHRTNSSRGASPPAGKAPAPGASARHAGRGARATWRRLSSDNEEWNRSEAERRGLDAPPALHERRLERSARRPTLCRAPVRTAARTGASAKALRTEPTRALNAIRNAVEFTCSVQARIGNAAKSGPVRPSVRDSGTGDPTRRLA
jgi:hypothetical protein